MNQEEFCFNLNILSLSFKCDYPTEAGVFDILKNFMYSEVIEVFTIF